MPNGWKLVVYDIKKCFILSWHHRHRIRMITWPYLLLEHENEANPRSIIKVWWKLPNQEKYRKNYCKNVFALAYIDNHAKRMGIRVLHASRLSYFWASKVLQTVQTLWKLNVLKSTVIDIFLFLHNFPVNKVLFTKT